MVQAKPHILLRIGWASAPLASGVLAGQAWSASDGGKDALEEVVVTAEKRPEDLQNIPYSIQALTQAQLDAHEVSNFADFAKLLPSISYLTTGPGQTQVFFRGITNGGDFLHSGSLPTSGVYLDEIPVTTIGSLLDVHMYDIARVEALAGPQGTLYGASSLAGTLRIITNAPDMTRFSAAYDVKIDKFRRGDGGASVEGFVNLPLGDRLAVRLVGFDTHDGGYINNVFTSNTIGFGVPAAGIPDTPVTYNNLAAVRRRFNPVDTYGGRAALKVDLNEVWTVTPQILAQSQRALGDFLMDPKHGDLNVADYVRPENRDRWYQAALTIEGKVSDFDVVYAGGWFERHVDNTQDYAGYTIGYDQYAHLPDATNNYVRFLNPDGSLIDNPIQYLVNRDQYSKMSHELRLRSPGNFPLQGTIGVFYQRQTDDTRSEYRIDDLPVYYAVDGSSGVYYLTQQTRVDRDYAVFTDLSYDLGRHFTLSAGIRRFWANNTLFGFFGYGLASGSSSGELSCAPPVSPTTIIPGFRPCVNTDKKVVENGETHRINLTYRIDSGHTIYLQYSTGFRPGGNNRRVGIAPYGPDTIVNIEGGTKTSWFADRLRINADVYLDRWKGSQVAVPGQFGVTSIVNVGDARSKGLEAEIQWVPGRHWLIAASGAYSSARILQNFCALDPKTELVTHTCADPVAPAGSRLPIGPSMKANASARFSVDLLGYESYFQGTVAHQGSTGNALAGAIPGLSPELPRFNTFDFVAGAGKHAWSLEAYAENAFDRRGVLGSYTRCVTYYCLQNYHVYTVTPMNFGIKFSQKF